MCHPSHGIGFAVEGIFPVETQGLVSKARGYFTARLRGPLGKDLPRHAKEQVYRTRSLRPIWRVVVDLMPLRRQMALTDVPYFLAIVERVSPERTV